MLDVVEQTAGDTAETTVADAGYRSAHQEIQAHEQGRTVLVPEHGRDKANGNPYHRSQFAYDAERDRYTCPEGQPLEYTRTTPALGNKPEARTYRCKACKHCPVRSHCTTNKTGRTIRRDAYEDFRAQQRAHRATPEAKALMRRRKAIVEPLFGHIKENLGFRRWSARGLNNAKVQWAMLCLAVNLGKLYTLWKQVKTQLHATRTPLHHPIRHCERQGRPPLAAIRHELLPKPCTAW
jgi:ABC-2 type transport system ATP-binding protein/transposase